MLNCFGRLHTIIAERGTPHKRARNPWQKNKIRCVWRVSTKKSITVYNIGVLAAHAIIYLKTKKVRPKHAPLGNDSDYPRIVRCIYNIRIIFCSPNYYRYRRTIWWLNTANNTVDRRWGTSGRWTIRRNRAVHSDILFVLVLS